MTNPFFTVLTRAGEAKLAKAMATSSKVIFTHMAVGDSNGTLSPPDPTQTQLINQHYFAPITQLSVDPKNSNQLIAELIIPAEEGGYWIREIGLFDEDNLLIAIANCPESYKPKLQEGSGRTQGIRMVLAVASTHAVTLKIDDTQVLASRQYVDDNAHEIKNHVDRFISHHEGATNPHPQYLMLNDIDHYMPVGIPFPWPLATPPQGFFKCNGAFFDKTQYPKLALSYPSGTLPDFRGEFIRGWDDGRGIDPDRQITSRQDYAIQNIKGYVVNVLTQNSEVFDGALNFAGNGYVSLNIGNTNVQFRNITFDAARVVQTASETRPRNLAFNFIVRAA